MAAVKKLTPKEVDKWVAKHDAWTVSAKHDSLTQSFSFASAVAALAFAAKITVHAELLQHHPVIELSHSKVKIKLHTNDVKGLTTKDFDLAKRIEGMQCS